MTHPLPQSGAAAQPPSIGRWSIPPTPQGWAYLEGFGIRKTLPDSRTIAPTVGLSQDRLDAPTDLAEYIARQVKLIQAHLPNAKTAGPQQIAFPAADEAHLFFIRHRPQSAVEVDILHAQTYVRVALWVGIVTLTTPEAQLQSIRPVYEAFLKGLRILPPSANP